VLGGNLKGNMDQKVVTSFAFGQEMRVSGDREHGIQAIVSTDFRGS
jgi:hypothetical protein